MRSNSSGPATFLMFLALAAMAIVGVFGLPQFPPAVASSENEIDDDLPDDLTSFVQSEAGESVAQGVEDLFAAVETPHDKRLSPDDEAFPAIGTGRAEGEAEYEPGIVDLLAAAAEEPPARIQPVSDSSAAENHLAGLDSNQQPIYDRVNGERGVIARTKPPRQQPDPRNSEFDSRFGRRPQADSMPTSFGAATSGDPTRQTGLPAAAPAARFAAAGKPLTWRSAVDRLRALGITHYRLAPGTTPNGFHFSCFFSPGGDPRITQRFEAEANEPLGAVEKVLTQVDDWRNQHGENRRKAFASDVAGPVESNAVADRSGGR